MLSSPCLSVPAVLENPAAGVDEHSSDGQRARFCLAENRMAIASALSIRRHSRSTKTENLSHHLVTVGEPSCSGSAKCKVLANRGGQPSRRWLDEHIQCQGVQLPRSRLSRLHGEDVEPERHIINPDKVEASSMQKAWKQPPLL